MRETIMILLALLLWACAQGYIWQHPDKDPYTYNDDAATCNTIAQDTRAQVARDMRGESDAQRVMDDIYYKTFDDCMEAKGWRKEKIK